MRDNAARALPRAEDEMPLHRVELRSVDSTELRSVDAAYADLRARASERRFERTSRPTAAAAVAAEEPALEPSREPVRLPRTAPGRSYGAHRRGDDHSSLHAAGPQPGRRTIEITGQAAAPRRQSSAASAFVARPDRTAQWAFLLALFLVVMAIATASA